MTTASNIANDEAQIRAYIDDWAKAIRTKNALGVLSRYAAAVVHFSLAPPLISMAADAKGLNAWFSTWQGPIGYEIRNLSITVGDDVAFCHSLNRISGTKTDGEKSDIWFRHTLGFRKIGGEWKITHEHESVPFYMDGSYKAAVDLKP
ncbi:MAG: YybH family protein [Gammaproteobacteria bacterium]